MIRHSESLTAIWQLAEEEVTHLRHRFSEPAHFFLGILRIADPGCSTAYSSNDDPLEAKIGREVSELLTCLGEFILDFQQGRRILRDLMTPGVEKHWWPLIQRSEEARRIFAAADDYGRTHGGIVLPTHLLLALLESSDPLILAALERLDTDLPGFHSYVSAYVHRSAATPQS